MKTHYLNSICHFGIIFSVSVIVSVCLEYSYADENTTDFPNGSATISSQQTEAVQLYAGYEDITFKSTTSSNYGGAISIFSTTDSECNVTNNESVLFQTNTAQYCGGAIYSETDLKLNENCNLTFEANSAAVSGGGIANTNTADVKGNDDVLFVSNAASGDYVGGGAISNESDGTFILQNNSSVSFSSNASHGKYGRGGAIANSGDFCMIDNGYIRFNENSVAPSSTSSSNAVYGGVLSNGGSFALSNNDVIEFASNSVTSSYSTNYNSYVTQISCGGVIYNNGGDSETAISNNTSLTFSNNLVTAYASGVKYSYSGGGYAYAKVYGGAIYNYEGTMLLSNNSSISFQKNKTSASAVYNSTTESGTSGAYSYGGAIYNSGDNATISLSSNGDILFASNVVVSISTTSQIGVSCSGEAQGGAIYNTGVFSLADNGNVIFEKNTEITQKSYRLRSIYSTGTLNLLAQAENKIIFRDSVYADGVVSLNEGGSGDIIFTGESTVKDLNEVLGDNGETRVVAEGDSEVINSRTSVLAGTTTLCGGHLIVKENAILNISDLTVNNGDIFVESGAQLNLSETNITLPTLILKGGTVTLGTKDSHAATLTTGTLIVGGNSASVINADLVISDGGQMFFTDNQTVTLGCSVTIGGGVTLELGKEAQSVAVAGNAITLMTDVEALTYNGQTYNATDLDENLVLSQVFANYQREDHYLVYTTNGELMVTPEPSTATLSFLVLLGLCVRRHR